MNKKIDRVETIGIINNRCFGTATDGTKSPILSVMQRNGYEEPSYYDSQKINVPNGKVVKQVGTYSYMTQNEMYKTVPVVEIMAE